MSSLVSACGREPVFALTDLPEATAIALPYDSSSACILDTDHQPICWGEAEGLGALIGTSRNLHLWSTNTLCDLDANDQLRCIGETPLVIEEVEKVTEGMALLNDGTVQTFGWRDAEDTFFGADFVDISFGSALSTSRGLVCSFCTEDDNSFVGLERAFGNSHWICGFSRSVPDPECVKTFGAPTYITTANVPTPLGAEFEFFASDMGVACLLEPSTGRANCWWFWDQISDRRSTALSSTVGSESVDIITDITSRTWLALAASRANICGVTTEGEVRCYGSDFFWLRAPDG